jgi:FkbM family methyltransferase
MGEERGAGRTLRLPQGLRRAGAAIVGRIPMRIKAGPNRGLRWSVVSAGRGAVAGTFEHERVSAITSLLQKGDCVWDIGAHKGYVTLAASQRVGKTGHVYAFEPAPPNLEFLRRHIAWNEPGNVDVMPYAVSAVDGAAQFGGTGSSITYRLGQGAFDVTMRSVRSLLAEGLQPPDVMKIDVEGSESDVLRGGGADLRPNGLIFVAIHSHAQFVECTTLLLEAGWRVVNSRAVSRIASRTPIVWEADPDILAIGPSRRVDRAALAAFER